MDYSAGGGGADGAVAGDVIPPPAEADEPPDWAMRVPISSGASWPCAAVISGRRRSRTLRARLSRRNEGISSVCTAVRKWQTLVGPDRVFSSRKIASVPVKIPQAI